METSSKSTKSRHRPASKEELLQVSDDALLDSEVSVVSQSSAWSVRKQVLLGEASDPAIALTDTEDKQDETATNHSRQSGAKSSVHPEEDETATLGTPSIVPAEKRTTSISSFLAPEQDGRLSRASQFTDMDQFSSSLHSVFTYDHPQKSTMAQNVMDLLFCSNELHLCEQEKRALRYYANDQEEKLARYCAHNGPGSTQQYKSKHKKNGDAIAHALHASPVVDPGEHIR